MKLGVHKKAFLCVLTLLAVLNIKASAQQKTLELGVKGGATYTQVFQMVADQIYYKDKPGYSGGIFVPVTLGEKLNIQPEALINYRALEASFFSYDERFFMEADYFYLELPLLVRYKLLESLQLEAGASASYLINESSLRLTYKEGVAVNHPIESAPFTPNTFNKPHNWNYSAQLGAAYTFAFGVELNARVGYQFRESYDNIRVSERINPITYQLYVAYKLPFISIEF